MPIEYDEKMYFSSGRHLFRMVIRRAQEEAEGTNMLAKREENREELKARARRWLSEPSLDLALVCDLADISFKEVMAYSRKVYGCER